MQTTPVLAPDLFGPEELVRGLRQLPSSPKVLPKLLDILRDDRAAMEDVVTLIKIDPGMAARVLQIGNSAYYSASQASLCPTMEDAVYRVGLVKVYELVAYAATAHLLMRRLRCYGLEPHDVWQMAVTTGLAAEKLASRVGADFNTAYTVGLLHGLGLVVIDTWAISLELPPRFRLAAFPDETTGSEKALLGFSNASVAAALLRFWGFPAQITEPIRWQYSPAAGSAHKKMAALLYVAKWLRYAVHATPSQPVPPMPDAAILNLVPCSAEDVEGLIDEVRKAFLQASLLLVEPIDE